MIADRLEELAAKVSAARTANELHAAVQKLNVALRHALPQIIAALRETGDA